MKLVVVTAFATYSKGDEITEPEAMQQVLASEQAECCVKVATPDPDPEPDAPVKTKK